MINAQAIFRRYCVVTDPIILLSYYIQKEIPLGLALVLKSIKKTSLQSEEHNLKATIFSHYGRGAPPLSEHEVRAL